MTFRIDDISIHLMPSQDKDEKEDRGRGRGKPPKDEDSSHKGDQGQACTMITAAPEVQKRECPGTPGGGVLALGLLQAQLRDTLAPPPL